MCLRVVLNQPTLTPDAGVLPKNQPAMRWCAYPGERLAKKTWFEVNGNPLDEYYSDAYNFYREYQVQPNKMAGWNRCMGQEMAHKGHMTQANWVNNNSAPAAGDHRFVAEVVDGNQTPSGQKPQDSTGQLELFIPLLFWFNKDPRLSVPSVSIPYGQRFINVELASREELVNLYPRGTGTWAAPNGTLTNTKDVEQVELYINNILQNMDSPGPVKPISIFTEIKSI